MLSKRYQGKHAATLSRRAVRTAFRLAATGGLVAGVGLVGPSAGADAPLASYAATITPTQVEASSSTTHTATISNASAPSSTLTINSASVTAPVGFAVTGVGAPTASNGQTWTVTRIGNTVQLAGGGLLDGLLPGQSVSVPITATATSVPGPSYVWTTSAANAVALVQFSRIGPEPTVAVVNDATVCEPNQTCTAGPVSTATTTATVQASAANDTALLTLSVGGNYPRPSCASFAAQGDVVTHDVTSTARTQTVSVTYPKNVVHENTNNGLAHYEICFDPIKPGSTPYLLPDCPVAPMPCVVSRSVNAAKVTVTYRAPGGDPRSIGGINI